MKWTFDRPPRHPLLEAGKRVNSRQARGTDLEAFFRRLLSTPLHLATPRSPERLEDADFMVLELASEDRTALPAYLDAPAALVTVGQIGGWAAVSGSDACRVARERHCHELAIFADPQRDPELVVHWEAIDWLGAGLVPFWERNAGAHAILAGHGLENACRAAVAAVDEIEMAQLIEGVAAEGHGRAVILATVSDSIYPRRWFELRDRIEAELLEAGHVVTAVTEPEPLIAETTMTAEWHESPSPITDRFIKILGGSQGDPLADAEGESIADATLRTDVWNTLSIADQVAAGAPADSCPDRRVVRVEVLATPQIDEAGMLQGPWRERWTIDRCGVQAPYVIDFRAADEGGVNFKIGEFALPDASEDHSV